MRVTTAGLALVAGFVGVVVTPVRIADAVLMRPGVPAEEYRALGDLYHGRALHTRLLWQGTTRFHCSAVRLNQWYALTAAHCYAPNGSGALHAGLTQVWVANGPSFNSPGEIRRVVNIIAHPQWDRGMWIGATPDLAILQLESPLPGPDAVLAPFPALSSLSSRVVTGVGYGRFGHGGGDVATFGIGTRHGYQSDSSSTSVSIGHAPYYWSLSGWFVSSFSNDIRLLGRALPGDSGSPVFDDLGNLVGLAVAGSPAGTTSDLTGTTIVNSLHPFAAWIAQNTIAPCSRADIAKINQGNGPDGQLTPDDIILFLTRYFASDWRADVAGPNQSIGPDEQFSADDLIVFFAWFFQGC